MKKYLVSWSAVHTLKVEAVDEDEALEIVKAGEFDAKDIQEGTDNDDFEIWED